MTSSPSMTSDEWSVPAREAVAYHEAGHIVAWWSMGEAVKRAAIDLPAPAFGCVVPDRVPPPDALQQALSETASYVSQALFLEEDPRNPSHPDHTLQALQSLLAWRLHHLALDVLEDARERAIELITESWETVSGVAAALLEHGSLDERALEALRPQHG